VARQGEEEACGGLVGAWPEVEQAAEGARVMDAKASDTRQKRLESEAGERAQLEVRSGLMQVICAASGVRWDEQSEDIEGYVALDSSARAFSMRKPATSDLQKKKAIADTLFAEIEACIPRECLEYPPVECNAREGDRTPDEDTPFASADEY